MCHSAVHIPIRISVPRKGFTTATELKRVE